MALVAGGWSRGLSETVSSPQASEPSALQPSRSASCMMTLWPWGTSESRWPMIRNGGSSGLSRDSGEPAESWSLTLTGPACSFIPLKLVGPLLLADPPFQMTSAA